MEAQKAGFNAGDYIMYSKTVNAFNAKDSSGNSVRGLKKARIYNFLNSSTGLSSGQKAYIKAQHDYSLSTADKNALVSYVNALKISAEEKRDILLSCGFKNVVIKR
jgi:hypothetical protein